MSYSYLLHEAAQKDYEDALHWNMQSSQQAAEGFVIAVDHALELICNNLQAGKMNTDIIMNWA